MVISQPPGNNPSYYYRASVHLSALNALKTPYVLYMQLQHQKFGCRNGAVKHIFYRSDPRRDHQQIVLYSFCRSMRLLFI